MKIFKMVNTKFFERRSETSKWKFLKPLVAIFLMVTFLCLSLTACSQSVTGKWQKSSGKFKVESFFEDAGFNDEENGYIAFDKNGTYTINVDGEYPYSGEYKVTDESTIIMYYKNYSNTVKYSISADELTLSDGHGGNCIFKQ